MKINVDSAYFNHPKTRRLKTYCGQEADVFPIRLWAFCGEYFPKDGVLKGYSVPEIEGILGYTGTPGKLVEALLQIGFLDKDSENNCAVHDWRQHAGFVWHYKISGRKGGKRSGISRRKNQSKQPFKQNDESLQAKRQNASTIELNGIELNKDNYLVEPVQAATGPTPESLVKLWNTEAHANLPRVQFLSETRKRHAKARLADHPQHSFWLDLMARVNRSPLLRGEKGSWKCSFDWVLQPANMAKIVEGNYDAR